MSNSNLEAVERDGAACGFVAIRPEQSLEEQLSGCMRAIVESALARASGHMGAASDALQVHRNTLQRHCERLGIDKRMFRPRPKRVARADVRQVMRAIGASA